MATPRKSLEELANPVNVPRIRAFVEDQETESAVRQSLSDIGVENAVITAGDVHTATSSLAKQPSPRLLIIDITAIDDPVTAVLELMEVCEPGIGIIAIGSNNDIGLYRRLKNTGVVEYFFKPIIRDQLARSCNDVLTDRFDQPSLYAGKLVFMLGVRGGVGATSIATNAAWYLSEMRQRWTMLLDLDMQGGDAALQFDVAPDTALCEAFGHPERVDKLFLERAATHVSKRLNLLASLEPLGSTVEGSEEAVTSLLENLLRRYRWVLVDIPAGVAAYLPRVMQMPSTSVLIANATLSSARDMARWREQLGLNTKERRVVTVLNNTAPQGALPLADFTRACGTSPDITIPFDRDLAAAANYGTKAMQKCATFRRGVVEMIHEVTGEPLERSPSLLKRMFGS